MGPTADEGYRKTLLPGPCSCVHDCMGGGGGGVQPPPPPISGAEFLEAPMALKKFFGQNQLRRRRRKNFLIG